MPLVNEELKFKSNEDFNQNFQNQSNFNQSTQTNEPQKGLISLPPALMQLIPWIPLALEAMTGQKIPQIGGTMGEIQNSLTQIQFSLTQLINTQQQLYAKLENLEKNASQQLANLSQQLTSTNNNFRLIAQETKRSLEFSRQPKELENN